MRAKVLIVLFLLVFVLTGCATVGPASVKLSSETGARSAELGALHQQMVRNYFASERQRVETFLKEKWEPQFLRNFLGETQILKLLQESIAFDDAKTKEIQIALETYLTDKTEAPKAASEIIAALTKTRGGEPAEVRKVIDKFVPNVKVDAATTHIAALIGTHEPGLLIMEFAADAHEAIDKQRKEMIGPIDGAETRVLAELNESYATLARAHGTITARLEAASRAREQQDKLLMSAGIENPSAVRERLAGISEKIGNALEAAGNLKNPNEVAKTLKEKLKALF